MKRVKDCKDSSIMSPQDEQWSLDKFTLFVYCNFLVLLSTTLCSQNINKQNVNIADENHTDCSFLSRYHVTKSKNYLKRRSRIRHWIPMFIGTPCMKAYMKEGGGEWGWKKDLCKYWYKHFDSEWGI